MFDHVQIKVADLARSRAFYAATMGALGYGIVFEIPGVVVGFGIEVHNMFEIRQATEELKLTSNVHLAFKAQDEDQLKAFYKAALENGGTDNGQPGLRPDYEPDYYAAFVIDLDGNNIEAVTQITTG